jgi:hypothetical protein
MDKQKQKMDEKKYTKLKNGFEKEESITKQKNAIRKQKITDRESSISVNCVNVAIKPLKLEKIVILYMRHPWNTVVNVDRKTIEVNEIHIGNLQ